MGARFPQFKAWFLIFFFFVSLGNISWARAQDEELLTISSRHFTLNPLTPEIVNPQLTATGELIMEIKTVGKWQLKWSNLSEGSTCRSLLGNELSGTGLRRQVIPFKWEIDWMMAPGIYELPLNITLWTEDNQIVTKNAALRLELPFVANIAPQPRRRLQIADDNYWDRQLVLEIQANAPWILQVEMTQTQQDLALLCNALYKSSTIVSASSLTSPLVVRAEQPLILAQGEAGGEHRLKLEWQRSSAVPLQAGDYDFYLKFSLSPAVNPAGGKVF